MTADTSSTANPGDSTRDIEALDGRLGTPGPSHPALPSTAMAGAQDVPSSPHTGHDLTARYRAMLASGDPQQQQLAQAQLARLAPRSLSSPSGDRPFPRSRWGHVPLADLFADAGNTLHHRPNGTIETGHQPLHPSKSGQCVHIDSQRGLWYCCSCKQGGDAVGFVMALQGCDRVAAVRWLEARFGPPRGRLRRTFRWEVG